MRFLHVIPRYYPYIGGSEGYIKEISERLVGEGHSVTVFATDAWDLEHFWAAGKKTIPTSREIHNGVEIRRFPVHRLPFSPLTYPVLRRGMTTLSALPVDSTRLLFRLCRLTPLVPALERQFAQGGERFDLVHATNMPFDSLVFAAFRYAQSRGLPFLLTPFTHLGEPQDAKVRQYYTMRHQIALMRGSDRVILMTGLERDYLVDRGLPPRLMATVGVGVNPAEVTGGQAQRFREKYGVPGPIVFYVGTTAFDKGTHYLVEAMRTLWAKGREARLILAGPQMDHFLRYFQALPEEARQRCHLLGFISDQDKRDLFAAGDVFAMPSRTDSFGIVYLEAWLYGKPVIGAAAGGVPDVIADGQDGYLVPFGDVPALATRLEQFLDDKDRAGRFGEAGRQKVLKEMTWDVKYAAIRQIYVDLTGSRRGGRD